MTGYIYRYESPSKKSYIGQTMNIKDRRRKFEHFNRRYSGSKFDNAIKKYGSESFKFEILAIINNDSKEALRKELDKLEIEYIQKYDSYKNGYNMTEGGSGSKGCFQTEESRKILSEKAKLKCGELNPFYSKKHSDEAKSKISDANSKYEVVMINRSTDEELMLFKNTYDACRYLGLDLKRSADIGKCCRGYVSPQGKRYTTVGGYKWKYKEGSTTSRKTYTQASGNGELPFGMKI